MNVEGNNDENDVILESLVDENHMDVDGMLMI